MLTQCRNCSLRGHSRCGRKKKVPPRNSRAITIADAREDHHHAAKERKKRLSSFVHTYLLMALPSITRAYRYTAHTHTHTHTQTRVIGALSFPPHLARSAGCARSAQRISESACARALIPEEAAVLASLPIFCRIGCNGDNHRGCVIASIYTRSGGPRVICPRCTGNEL